jgi:hypothetical protein
MTTAATTTTTTTATATATATKKKTKKKRFAASLPAGREFQLIKDTIS